MSNETLAVVKLSDLVDLIDVDSQPMNPPSRTRQITSLKASISQHGLLTPLTVGPKGVDGKYRLISGYRRHAALKALGFKEAPARILTGPDLYLFLAAANIQNPLTLLQQARQAKQLVHLNYSHRRIRIALGLDQRGLSRRFDLLKADAAVQHLVDTGKMSWSAFDQLRNASPVTQLEILDRAEAKSRGTNKTSGRVTANAIQSARKDIRDEAIGTPFAGDSQNLAVRLHGIEVSLIEIVQLTPFSDGEKLSIKYRLDSIQGYIDTLKEKVR